MRGKLPARAHVPAKNYWSHFGLQMQANGCRGEPETLQGNACVDMVGHSCGRGDWFHEDVTSTSERGYEVQLDARNDCSTQEPVEKIHALPALHHPAHEFRGERINADGLVGDAISAVARIPLDDVPMDWIRFGAGESDFGVFPEQPGNRKAILGRFEKLNREIVTNRGDQRLFLTLGQRRGFHRPTLNTARLDELRQRIFWDFCRMQVDVVDRGIVRAVRPNALIRCSSDSPEYQPVLLRQPEED